MNIRKFLPWIVLAGIVGFVPASFAEVPISITAGGTVHGFDEDREVDDDVFPFGAIEYRFGQHWASEFFYSYGEGDADNDFADDVDVTQWRLDGLYYLLPNGKWHPYLAFGAGELERDWDVDAEYVDTQLNVGAGFRYYFTEHWNWRGDARVLQSLDENDTDVAVSFGISYSFAPPPGRPMPAAAPAPVEPEPEPEPLDSDGDGVIDRLDECPGTAAGVRVDDRGCEIVVPQVASIKLTVYFGFDSDDVDTRYFEDIEGLANFLNRFPELKVNVEGHTDSRGKDSYNMNLSQRRAEAVRDILVNQYGIDGSRLTATGYGETRPVDTNDTDEGRANNRRVMATLEVQFDQ